MTDQADDSGVVVWYRESNALTSDLRQRFAGLLSLQERQRMGGFMRAVDRDLYLTAHAMKRATLSTYFGVDPAQLKFEYDASGRPFLIETGPSYQLDFSISHAKSVAVVAITALGRIGVDVESIRNVPEPGVFEHLFAPPEITELNRLSGRDYDAVAILFWTAREAFSKAVGEGLSLPPGDLLLTAPNQSLEVQSIDPRHGAKGSWRFHNTRELGGYQLTAMLNLDKGGDSEPVSWQLRPWRYADGD